MIEQINIKIPQSGISEPDNMSGFLMLKLKVFPENELLSNGLFWKKFNNLFINRSPQKTQCISLITSKTSKKIQCLEKSHYVKRDLWFWLFTTRPLFENGITSFFA